MDKKEEKYLKYLDKNIEEFLTFQIDNISRQSFLYGRITALLDAYAGAKQEFLKIFEIQT